VVLALACVAECPTFVTQHELSDYASTQSTAITCIGTDEWTPTTPGFGQHCTHLTPLIGDVAIVKVENGDISVCIMVPLSDSAIVNAEKVTFANDALPIDCQQNN
jgi:hypothetical protein